MGEISAEEKVKYLLEHMSLILGVPEYKEVLTLLASKVPDDSLRSLLEKQTSNLVNDGKISVSTYIPIALLNTLDRRADYTDDIEICFDECSLYGEICKIISAPDLIDRLSDRDIFLSSTELAQYISNKDYLKDLDILYTIIHDELDPPKPRNPFVTSAEDYFLGVVDSATKIILGIYKDIFSSGYDVVQPDGILTSAGYLTLDGNKRVLKSGSNFLTQIYRIINEELQLEEKPTRFFSTASIDDVSLDDANNLSGKIPYFPLKLLEFAYGRKNEKSSGAPDIYLPDENAVSWDIFSAKTLEYGILNAIMSLVIKSLDDKGYLTSETSFIVPDATALVNKICEKAKIGFTACIVVSDWKCKKSKKMIGSRESVFEVPVGFKFRVVDMGNRLKTDSSLVDRLVKEVFSKNFKEGVGLKVPTATRGKYVKEYSIQFDKELYALSPLFAYKALDAFKRRGVKPSWKNLLLGRKEDDSILSAGSSDIDFNSKLTHFIIAGSRSGKGVMTLNILASAIASNKPIFYLDRKPDMASLLKDMAMKGRGDGKTHMFVVNGASQSPADDTYGQFSDEALGDWDKNIPDLVKEKMGFNYTDLGDIFYIKALMFILSLISLRATFTTVPEVYEKLNGKDGIIAVIDELTNFAKFSEIGVKKKLGGSYVPVGAIDEIMAGGKKTVPLWSLYSTFVIDKLNSTLVSTAKGVNAGLGNTESGRSNIFVLGQQILTADSKGDASGVSKIRSFFDSKADNSGLYADCTAQVFQSALADCKADGFFGFNDGHKEYLCADPKGYTNQAKQKSSVSYLSEETKGFAYVKDCSKTGLEFVASGNSATADSALYFKPFLILNNANEDDTYVQQFRTNICKSDEKYNEIKSMNLDASGKLEPRIGFEEYIKSQGGTDFQKALEKSYNIGNYVVEKLGYTEATGGDVIDFIFDLRPEWWFSSDDIINAFKGKDNKDFRLGIIKKYAPELLSESDSENISDEQRDRYAEADEFLNQDIPSTTKDLSSETEKTESPVTATGSTHSVFEDDDILGDREEVLNRRREEESKKEESKPLENTEYTFDINTDSVLDSDTLGHDTKPVEPEVSEKVNPSSIPVGSSAPVDSSDNFSHHDTNSDTKHHSKVEDELGVDDLSNSSEATTGYAEEHNDSSLNPEESGISSSGNVIVDTPVDSNEYTFKNPVGKTSREEVLERKIEEQAELLRKMQETLDLMSQKDMQEKVNQEREKIKDKEIPQERVLSEPYTYNFMGKPFKIQRYDGKLDIGDDFMPTDDFKTSARMFRDISIIILNDIERMFGGLHRVTEFAVISDAVVINSTAYSPQLPDKFIRSLPLDVQNDVRKGRFAWIFDFSVLRHMTNLTSLLFNDADFLFKKVRIDLGKNKNFEPKDLFNICPNLMYLQIEEYEFTRNTMNAHDDTFHATRRSTEIADNLDAWGINATKSNWNSVKSIYHDPQKRGIWKALSVSAMTGATVATGAGTLGLRAGRKASKWGSRLFGSAKEVWRTMKENSH